MNQCGLDIGIRVIASQIAYDVSEEELELIASIPCQQDDSEQHDICNMN